MNHDVVLPPHTDIIAAKPGRIRLLESAKHRDRRAPGSAKRSGEKNIEISKHHRRRRIGLVGERISSANRVVKSGSCLERNAAVDTQLDELQHLFRRGDRGLYDPSRAKLG